jgi:hypothetical protein
VFIESDRLATIIGRISSDLYPTNRTSDANWVERAKRHTADLKAWKESLPAFLEPDKVDPSILIPTFQRQSTVLRLAYAHALILANRQALLSNFADLNRRQNMPNGKLEGSVKECIDAALLVVDMVTSFVEQGKMYTAFWFTHYVLFCAISSIYVHTIQQSISQSPGNLRPNVKDSDGHLLKNFESAEKCQRSISETTAKTSSFRRYNIILDELKREVMCHLGRVPTNHGSASNFVPTTNNDRDNLAQNHSTEISESAQVDDYLTNMRFDRGQSDMFPPQIPNQGSHGMVPGDHVHMLDATVLDPGLFVFQGELIGWSELDSCVGI